MKCAQDGISSGSALFAKLKQPSETEIHCLIEILAGNALEYMRGSRKFSFRGDPNLIKFFPLFLVDRGIEDTNTAINGQSSARQRNAIEIIGPSAKRH